jgi:Flp pilus assembly protein TadD
VARQPGRIVSLARNHASLLVDTGRPAEAMEVLDRGLAVSPDDPTLRGNRAAALGKLGRPAEALAEARRAVAASPGDPLMRNLLGQALAVNRDWAAALDEFRAAQAIDPGVPLYAVAVAVSLAELGRRDEACAAFQAAASRYKARPLPLDAATRAAALGCPLVAR